MANASTSDALVIDTIRALSMDAVQAANSGHPGTPMALAPLGWTAQHNEGRLQLDRHRDGEGVEDLRPVEREDEDAVVELGEDEGRRHGT